MTSRLGQRLERRAAPLVALLLCACAAAPPAHVGARADRPPGTRRVSQTDVYHGVSVSDPYRWLEALDSPEVRSFVDAENTYAAPLLESLPGTRAFRRRLEDFWHYERVGASLSGGGSFSVPEEIAGHTFYLHNDGHQDQSVLMVVDGAAPRVLLDPNGLAGDRTVALSSYAVAPDGRHLAYALSEGGTDWKTVRIRAVDNGRDLPESLQHIKFTPLAWSKDGSGFYYSRYPLREDGSGPDDTRPVSVWFHHLDTPQSSDRFVYAVTDHPRRNPYPHVSDDGRWLVVTVSEGHDETGIVLLDLRSADAEAIPLVDRYDAHYEYLGNAGERFFLLTTSGAPHGRIIAVDARHPEANPDVVVPEGASTMDSVHYVGGLFIINGIEDAHSVVRIHTTTGTAHTLDLPGLGSAVGFDGGPDARGVYYAYTDFLTPQSIYRLDLKTMMSSLFFRPNMPFDATPYVTEQVFIESKDGTRVPMYVTHRKDLRKDRSHPTMLYGYGGFNLSLLPSYSVPVAAWLDAGGIYAVANLRGGGEYGASWHASGTRTHKQNVFDDFIAASEWLLANGYTSKEHLVIRGRSNGGLLIGAVLLQRPDLYAAALPAVGVLDMMRYHTASANARQWSSDYGLVDDAAEFKALLAYSPVHNVKPGVCYPATLVTTAAGDDRVVPWHSYKFAAALQAAQPVGCGHPILLRVETRAGHGNDRPVWMQIEDYAEQWAFAAFHSGLKVTP
jgi:prolyl oligopeptidase